MAGPFFSPPRTQSIGRDDAATIVPLDSNTDDPAGSAYICTIRNNALCSWNVGGSFPVHPNPCALHDYFFFNSFAARTISNEGSDTFGEVEGNLDAEG